MEKRAKEGTSFETGVRMTGFQVGQCKLPKIQARS